jgi:GNAT superfamily N-acetyltransferase
LTNPDVPAVNRIFANQASWLDRLATGEIDPSPGHTHLLQSGNVSASRAGQAGVICLHETCADTRRDLPHLLAALDWLRDQGSGDVLIWSANPRTPLSNALLAHGMEESFEPWWMMRPLDDALSTIRADVDISLATGQDIDDLHATTAIPYVSDANTSTLRLLTGVRSGVNAVSLLVARDGNGVVGQAIINRTGEMAGLYNVAVHPDARRRGIGTALTVAACELARTQGARWVGLNATPMGAGVYERLRFRHIGKGQTWFLPERRLQVPPDAAHVEIAMRLIDGDLAGLNAGGIPPSLPNGETPMTFAARSGEPATLRWLLHRGFPPEILPLWRLGLRDEAIAAMAVPELRDRTIPPMHGTALHGAIQHGEIELARMLIETGADLTIRDVEYRSTALGWAEALGKLEIAAMIRQAGGG